MIRTQSSLRCRVPVPSLVMLAQILSIQVGLPERRRSIILGDSTETEWRSGIFKHRVDAARLGLTNLEGDGQADHRFHGGPDRAVLLFSVRHYPLWEERLARKLEFGSFGENLSVEGIDEETVCLGDIWETDNVTLEISQPRIPCSKLSRRLETPGFHLEVTKKAGGGFYARTLREGLVTTGDVLSLVSRPHTQWPVRRAFELYMYEKDDLSQLQELVAIPQLSQLWKDGLVKRLD